MPRLDLAEPDLQALHVYREGLAEMARRVWIPAARARIDRLERVWLERPGVLGWLTTTDHKRIGLLFFFTSLVFFAAGGVEALVIRSQLLTPDEKLVSPDTFDQLFTMHGLTMIFLFVIPMSTG